ncbi:hypothetical protein EJ04DRAFT_511468, partial [Polyplosphaeria fusca]
MQTTDEGYETNESPTSDIFQQAPNKLIETKHLANLDLTSLSKATQNKLAGVFSENIGILHVKTQTVDSRIVFSILCCILVSALTQVYGFGDVKRMLKDLYDVGVGLVALILYGPGYGLGKATGVFMRGFWDGYR